MANPVAAVLARDRASPNWALTSDEIATTLHEHMVGKTVVITGVSKGGLGAEAARVISQHSPKLLILASRTEAAIATVIDEISSSASPGADIRSVSLDLGSQASVRAAAAKVLALTPRVDVLINNAAVMMVPEFRTTPEGIEQHFGINHVGHFLFTNLIMLALLASPSGATVVNVSSAANAAAPVSVDDYNFDEGKAYQPFVAYARSKTANMLFTLSLVQKLGSRGLRSFGVDPGAVATTQLAREIPKEALIAQGWMLASGEWNPAMPWKSAEQSVASYIVAGYDPALHEHNGGAVLAAGIDTENLERHSADPDAADGLWRLSEKLVGQAFSY